jgi:hypothetical protein
VPCGLACAASSASADTPCHSSVLCGNLSTCAGSHAPTASLKPHASCCTGGCCRHWQLAEM